MSIVEWDSFSSEFDEPSKDAEDGVNGNGHANGQTNGHARRDLDGPRALHRLADVRRQQGVSLRSAARRLSLDIVTVRQQEEETADLPLSALYAWQRVLEVPVAELLVDSDAPLSPPVMQRAQMVKVMKTVAAMVEKADSPSMKRLLQMLCNQLLEIMPELAEVAPWHTVGQRRTSDEYGKIVERQQSDDVFRRSR